MINFKKGLAHSLAQVDKLGKAKAGEGVVSGMIVTVDTNGDVVKGAAAGALSGFAANDQFDGDVIESGKIGVVLLDGNSVVETDQVYDAITAANFPLGAAVYADSTHAGQVTKTATNNRQVGVVEGIRVLQAVTQPAYSYKKLDGTTVSVSANTTGFKVQGGPAAGTTAPNVLGIKLLAA